MNEELIKKEMNIISQNLKEEVTIFNYDKIVKNTITDFLRVTANHTSLSHLNEILYHELFDVYPIAMRDKKVWNKYYWRNVNSLNNPNSIAEIDVEGGGLNENEISPDGEVDLQ